ELEDNRAIAQVNLTLNYPGPKPEDVEMELQLVPENFPGEPSAPLRGKHRLRPGINHLQFNLEQTAPKLWWTWEHGAPNLYRLRLSVEKSGQILDQTTSVFGFRSINFDPEEQIWRLNGKRLFLRGTNYIASQWLSEMTEEKYSFDIGLMKQANINTVRVHAHIAAQSFYQLCDRAGLLVWQDFPLQWGYTDDPTFAKEAIRQGRDMINLLYNHPAIIAWSLHNEPPWDADWMKYKYKTYNPEQNRKLDQTLFAGLKDFDPTRHLHEASIVAEHPWWGWYSNTFEKYAEPTDQPLITEFGAQALPDERSLRHIFTAAELWPDTEAEWAKWEYHNFQRHETFEIAQVPMGNNTQEFIDNTQQYQANLIKFAAEAYRRQRFQPVSAAFQFMFVEDWPSLNWGIVDYWRNLKPGYAALQLAYQPVLPSIAATQQAWQLGEEINLDLWLINDLWQSFPEAKLTYTWEHNSTIVQAGQLAVDIAADSGAKVETLAYQPQQVGDYKLVVKLNNSKGEFLSQNTFSLTIIP
ncbi:MAG: glycoside hydrolase family 2, partial [Cyanothece sp. SIO1E1]|nr:glycoside hydrolase family 2 [Cyanothece sp. SIO1E1]